MAHSEKTRLIGDIHAECIAVKDKAAFNRSATLADRSNFVNHLPIQLALELADWALNRWRSPNAMLKTNSQKRDRLAPTAEIVSNKIRGAE